MVGWLKTAQGMLVTFATALAIVATWWQRRLLLVSLRAPDNRLQYDVQRSDGWIETT